MTENMKTANDRLTIEHVAFALFEHSAMRDTLNPAKEFKSLWQLLPEPARERWRNHAITAITAINSYKQSEGHCQKCQGFGYIKMGIDNDWPRCDCSTKTRED